MTRAIPGIVTTLLLAAISCAHERPPPPPVEKPVTASAPPSNIVQKTLADVGIDASAMDRSVDPCDDFYHYACGTWIRNTPIPADKPRWTRSFNVIDETNKHTLQDILEKARKVQDGDPVIQKIGSFYNACLDEETAEKNGMKPLQHYLKLVRGVKDHKSLVKAIIELHKAQFWVLFGVGSTQDSKDATKMIAELDQSGLGLPDRDFYTDPDPHKQEIREFYQAHIGKMLTDMGDKETVAKSAAKNAFDLETQLAKISKTRVERRDPVTMYNKVDLEGLKKLAPDFPWEAYLKELGHPDIREITVTSPSYFENLNRILKETKPAEWRSYLEWHVVHSLAPTLTKALVDENFALTQKLNGQDKIEDRWKRCVEATDGALGELLAQPFVQQAFAGDSKKAADTMVGEIRSAFGRNLAGLDWMDDATRAKAKTKLEAVSFLIGYPDVWKRYDYAIDPSNYAENVLASRAYELNRDLNKIGKPVDRGEWDMSPPTVNAYYNPQKNQMVFPAGILQSPFFAASSDVAVNMGGIGYVMGHELTHGFDDQGAQYDSVGNLASWWAPEVKTKFDAKGQCIADQYTGYHPLPSDPAVHLNGKLTEGENIADNGGLKLAFSAYRHMRESAPEKIVADGFTEDQQFFLAAAQVWCTNAKEAFIRTRVTTDPHSAPQFRVNGPASNLSSFAEAFQCKVGTPMHPEKPCAVW